MKPAEQSAVPSETDGERLDAIVAEEEALLTAVLRVLAQRPGARLSQRYRTDLTQLRDSLEEERLEEDQASVLEQMERLKTVAAMQARRAEEAQHIDVNSPYFGHLGLVDDKGQRRDVLIGRQTFIASGVTVVDWRHAPISRVFYQCEEGDDFELDIDGHELTGQVITRRTLTISEGKLLRIGTPHGSFVKLPAGWTRLQTAGPALRGGAGSAVRPDSARPVLGLGGLLNTEGQRLVRSDKHLPQIAALLDADQFGMITQPGRGILAIQASAGSGKTTVALHRIAFLAFHDPRRFAPSRCLMLVYSDALVNYVSQVLPALGVDGVPVKTVSRWMREQRRRHFPRMPDRYRDDTPAVVTRFKLHQAMVPLLAEAAAKHPHLSPTELFDELLTHREWLQEAMARLAPGDFTSKDIDRVHRWCSQQHGLRTEPEDGDGEDLPGLDTEDDALLLRLHQLLVGPLTRRSGKPVRYTHLVIDEVQDTSPIELLVLLQTAPSAPITLAGDLAQKVVEDSAFSDWSSVLSALGLGHVRLSPLKVSYRSTGAIMRLAHAVLGPLAPAEEARITREGEPVELFVFPGRGQSVAFLTDQLRHLIEAEPTANVALLARHAIQAEEAYQALLRADLPRLRRVEHGDFSFGPGIEVTDVRQSKGLEFDYVVMLDVDADSYPNNPVSRHLMHVGITRAAHQCWMVSVGRPSVILPASLIPTPSGY